MPDGVCSSDTVLLATGGYDKTIHFWEAHTGVCTRTCQHADSQVNALTFRPDRTVLAAAGYRHVRLYDVKSAEMTSVEALEKNVTAVGFQAESRWMFTGGDDSLAQIWDMKASGAQCQRMFQAERPLNSVVLHPNQVELFMADLSGTIYQWDLRSDNHSKIDVNSDCSINHLDIDSAGKRLAAIDSKGFCYIYSLAESPDHHSQHHLHHQQQLSTIQLLHSEKVHKRLGLKCKFSPNGSLLCTTWAGSSVCIWNVPDLTLHRRLDPDPDSSSGRWVWDCAFSSDAKYLLTASSDESARLWCVDTAEVIRIYKGHSKALTALAFAEPA